MITRETLAAGRIRRAGKKEKLSLKLIVYTPVAAFYSD
jgi:hypothetical protein